MEEMIRVLDENKEYIVSKWVSLANEGLTGKDGLMLLKLEDGFRKLLENLIGYLAQDDLNGYYMSSIDIIRDICCANISYHTFIEAFHLFETSYIPMLFKRISASKLPHYLVELDDIHHHTIILASEEYFRIKDSTVDALLKLTEIHDDTTGSHLERMREYLYVIGKELGLKAEDLSNLCKAGPLHDIGKVGVRSDILSKPAALTCDEFEEMKKHTEIGAKAIENILPCDAPCENYLKIARDIALFHHERYDGQGYLKGLKGEEIPLEARLFSIVDAYDAIVSRRPYKEPLSHEEAVKRILNDSGKQFDPFLVEIFMKINKEFEKISGARDQ